MPPIALGDTVISERRIFLTKTFARWFRKTDLSEQSLCEAIVEMISGLVDADLGHRWFFLYGFAKNERTNIDGRELAALQKLAAVLLKLDAGRLAAEIELGNLSEICHEAQPHPQ